MTYLHRLLPMSLLISAMLFSFGTGCTPARSGVTSDTVYSTGYPEHSVKVAKPLTLFAHKSFLVTIPSEVSVSPSAIFRFAMFTDPAETTITRSAHSIAATIQPRQWRFMLEMTPDKAVLAYEKQKYNGKYWTVQVMPVPAAGDWFTELYATNGKQTPKLWLAKRWSTTPTDNQRFINEYREAAPLCLQNALAKTHKPSTAEILARCGKEIDAFSLRADGIFTHLDTAAIPTETQPETNVQTFPTTQPNIKKLVGEAEPTDTRDFILPD